MFLLNLSAELGCYEIFEGESFVPLLYTCMLFELNVSFVAHAALVRSRA